MAIEVTVPGYRRRGGLGTAVALLALVLSAWGRCASATAAVTQGPTWAYAGKTGVGTAYEAYDHGGFGPKASTGPVSKVWFSIADGLLTEVSHGLIHETQMQSAWFAVKTDSGVAMEPRDVTSQVSYLHTDRAGRPLSPAYRILGRDRQGRFEIEKRIFTDPDRDVVFMRVRVRALKGPVTPTLVIEPRVAMSGRDNIGEVSAGALTSRRGAEGLAVVASRPFSASAATPVGDGDIRHDLEARGALPASTHAEGWIEIAGDLPTVLAGQSRTVDIALGFGPSTAAAEQAARATLKTGYREVLAHFNGEGARVGWEDYLASLHELPRVARMAKDGGRLAYASAITLKAHEDHTHPGALVASLSNPWGETAPAETPQTGYKAVWPRDLYQIATAMAALGDRETPVAALRHMHSLQVPAGPGHAGGWMQQKTRVDGVVEWNGVQLDQTAFPIMLAWRLHRMGLIDDAALKSEYAAMVRPAADFLVDGGHVALGDNQADIHPPFTQQERWEEQSGYSPSTMAAVTAGLTAAARIATAMGDTAGADRFQAAADRDRTLVDRLTVTRTGALSRKPYFLRLSPTEDPDDHAPVPARNGQPAVEKDRMLDPGFLELVRYGVIAADDPVVENSLSVLDNAVSDPALRVRYDIPIGGHVVIPAFRRYGGDGYGEDVTTGLGYFATGADTPGQRGRIWPLLTGERGHYALALAGAHGRPARADIERIRTFYVAGMESFANAGLMLSEQVWDGVGVVLPHHPGLGAGTGSATPLAWSHAEYLKLLRSLADGQVFDRYHPVFRRYAASRQKRP